MSIWKNEPFTQHEEYEYALAPVVIPGDAGAAGVYTLSAKPNKFALPVGAVAQGFFVLVQTDFAGAGASVSIGNSSSATAYMASTAVATLVKNYLVVGSTPAVITAANLGDVKLTVSGGTLTAGQLKVVLRFNYPNS